MDQNAQARFFEELQLIRKALEAQNVVLRRVADQLERKGQW